MKKLPLLALSLSLTLSVASFAKKQADAPALSPSEAAQNLIKVNDANKDGKLSKNEVNLSFRVKRFNTVDKNKDGFLDEAELENSYSKSAQVQEKKASDTTEK
jgi:Ca2+-binding EF-hand superfamily protein